MGYNLIKLELHNKINIHIDTENTSYLRAVKDHFSLYVEGFRFMPAYNMGGWDGKVCLFNTSSRTIPYGLLPILIRFTKAEYPEETLTVSSELANIFKCLPDPKITNILKYEPRPYQLDCILTALKYGLGIIKSSVASGKSLIIAYILQELFATGKIKNALIMVPTLNLVSQFFSDLTEYGFSPEKLGKLDGDHHDDISKEILISTWQSVGSLLKKSNNIIKDRDCIITDEVHIAQARTLQKILSHSTNAVVRLGFTGTLPVSKLDMWQIQSYIGPILKEYTSSDLAKLGYVSKCTINMINVKYRERYKGEYNDIKDGVFRNDFRLNLIKNIIKNLDGNVLILIGKIEKEGELLKQYLQNSDVNKEVVFIWGNTKTDERDHWRLELEKRKNIALIASYPIFSMGVNIPSLKYILFASPVKSNIRVLQSVGRALRVHTDKTDGAKIFDIVDQVKYLNDHGRKRIKYYIREQFEIVEEDVVESYS